MFWVVFLDFEVWVKDFKVFDLRFGFLVKNCIYFHPRNLTKTVGANFNNRGVIIWTSGLMNNFKVEGLRALIRQL